ncbi:MAG: SAM-dependent methyltransferase [Candidatus Bathyarchaeum sp.]|nr:MAG: SAM-dependent methyltransferase [Candidatus Bathyarchaeum sp.]
MAKRYQNHFKLVNIQRRIQFRCFTLLLEGLPKIFFVLHSNLPREGPGDNESTRKAYRMLKDLPEKPRILDVGCGPGMQTIELAKLSASKIVALDFHQPFLDQLKASAEKENLQDKIETVLGRMMDMKFKDKSFDLIWSEGAIFIIGFEKGLREWKRLLADKGYLVVSEMCYLRPDVPDELVEVMKDFYPVIKSVEGNLDVAKKAGYRVVDSFVLPSKSWWDNYFNPIQEKLPAIKEKYKDDKEAMEFVAFQELELKIFRMYSDYYGYVFYLFQNK